MVIADTATPERDIWVMDVARGTTSRATFDPAADWFPTWGPDGIRMFFGSTRVGATAIFHKTGAGQDELFSGDGIDRRFATYPNDVSNDGRFLVFTQTSPKGYDLGVFPLVGERKPSTFLSTPFNEAQGRFSKFATDNPKANTTWSTDAIRIAESGDLAIQTGEYRVTGLGPRGDGEDKGRFVTVWKKVDGEWKLGACSSYSDTLLEDTHVLHRDDLTMLQAALGRAIAALRV
jgi:Tol biopolymer transport system component